MTIDPEQTERLEFRASPTSSTKKGNIAQKKEDNNGIKQYAFLGKHKTFINVFGVAAWLCFKWKVPAGYK